MKNEGLYYYKLVSPYSDDVTKNCKLTVNEIDTNFLHLKDMDIEKATYDEETASIILSRFNGDQLIVDLTPLIDGIKKLTVSYDELEGTIIIQYGDEITTIDGLVTRANLEECKKVITDGTIKGNGTKGSPLGVNPNDQTGQYQPVKGFIDMTTDPAGELPSGCKLGDRYITLENSNKVGYLYNYLGVKEIKEYLEMLDCGWRIPTKADWDNMLNAIEICDEARNHDSELTNIEFGQIAGKLLKSTDSEWQDGELVKIWKNCGETVTGGCGCCDDTIGTEEYVTIVDEDGDEIDVKEISTSGVDSYGFRVLPTGYHDGCAVYYYCGEKAGLWTDTIAKIGDVYVKRFDSNKAGVVQIAVSPLEMHGLRLVKDYTGDNFFGTETISGLTYDTVLMPSYNTEHGFTVWTASNFRSEVSEGNQGEVGECLDGIKDVSSEVYYLNYWNGFCWEKKEFKEGESVVFYVAWTDGQGNTYPEYADGLTAVHDVEFRIIDGQLVAVNDVITQSVLAAVEGSIESEIGGLVEDIEPLEDELGFEVIRHDQTRKTVILNMSTDFGVIEYE